MSRLRHEEPPTVPVRYEREKAGELLHVDIKRLGRFDRVGHRITHKRSFGSPKQGFEFVYVAIDDFSRLSYVDTADERSETASSFLKVRSRVVRDAEGQGRTSDDRQRLGLPGGAVREDM